MSTTSGQCFHLWSQKHAYRMSLRHPQDVTVHRGRCAPRDQLSFKETG
ncbi:MAG: hypothetical protein IPK71_37085 [Myxococcales bacterium]|nr:hypothetical protein [Myxococcales bacterium]